MSQEGKDSTQLSTFHLKSFGSTYSKWARKPASTNSLAHTTHFLSPITPQPMLLVGISIGKRMLQWKIVTSEENKTFCDNFLKAMLINIYAEYLYSKKVCCISTLKTRSESITFSYGNINLLCGCVTAKVRFALHFFISHSLSTQLIGVKQIYLTKYKEDQIN